MYSDLRQEAADCGIDANELGRAGVFLGVKRDRVVDGKRLSEAGTDFADKYEFVMSVGAESE